jgi:hypothetical protein
MEDKTKETGKIKKTGRIIANGFQFLNGEVCGRFAKVPIILLDYETPENAHLFAKGERLKFWIKLEEKEWETFNQQLKKGLREVSIWFDEENKAKLKEFLN